MQECKQHMYPKQSPMQLPSILWTFLIWFRFKAKPTHKHVQPIRHSPHPPLRLISQIEIPWIIHGHIQEINHIGSNSIHPQRFTSHFDIYNIFN